MHRTDLAPFHARFPQGAAHTWLARRWYYTPRSHRAYSVRQISPGDRRLLAEFALTLGTSTRTDRELRLGAGAQRHVVRPRDRRRRRQCGGICRAREHRGRGSRDRRRAPTHPTNEDSASFSIAVAQHVSRGAGRTHSAVDAAASCEARRRAAPDRRDASGRTGRCRCSPCRWASRSSPMPRDRNLRRLVLPLK